MSYSNTLICLLLILQICSFTLSQVIVTDTLYGKKNLWTTGNKMDLHIEASDKSFFGLLPETQRLPLIINPAITDFVKTLDWYIDQIVIMDFSNIDPKDFRPEQSSFKLAFQRRMDPFFYIIKIFLAAAFAMYFIRLHYGHLGGFKKKVIRLRIRSKKRVNFMTNIALTFLILFGILWLSASIYSNVLDYRHIVKFAKTSSVQVKD